jgi:hypothetical protein
MAKSRFWFVGPVGVSCYGSGMFKRFVRTLLASGLGRLRNAEIGEFRI